MMKSGYIRADVEVGTKVYTAEYDSRTGRLRVLDGVNVRAEWFPPYSWFAIASVAGRNSWGTRPSKEDLQRVVDDFADRQRDDSFSHGSSRGDSG